MKKNRSTKNRLHATAHRRALTRDDVQRGIAELRQTWRRIDRVERGDRLRELINLGCSTRGMAEALRISATTVRRHLEISALPQPEREAVTGGASAKRALAATATRRRQRRAIERLLLEKQSGTLSNSMADVVIAFCRGDYLREIRIPRLQLAEFLFSVAQHLRRLSSSGARRPRLSKKLTMLQMLKRVRPAVKADVLPMEHHAEWLARLIWLLEPEPKVWQASLGKTEQRSKELEKKEQVKTPLQLYRERVKRLALLSAPPPRRRY